MISIMSAGSESSTSSGRNNSRVASMSGASNGSEACSESVVMSGVLFCVSSEIDDMI